MKDSSPQPSKEIPFQDVLLPQLLRTYRGLTEKHLKAILGDGSMDLKAVSDGFWVKYGMINFNLTNNFHKIAHIGGILSSKSQSPANSFIIDAIQLDTITNKSRGFRLLWDNNSTDLNNDPEELIFDSFRVLPLVGELYKPYNSQEQILPSEGGPSVFEASDENMHFIQIEKINEGQVGAFTTTRKPYPIVIEKDGGSYAIRASADGVIFNTPFSIVIPSSVRLDKNAFKDTLKLIA